MGQWHRKLPSMPCTRPRIGSPQQRRCSEASAMLLTRPAPHQPIFAPAVRAVIEHRPPTASAALNVCVLAACPFPANHGTPGSIREMSEAVAALGHEVHIVTYHIGEAI